MPPAIDWSDIAVRLALTLVAGGIVGFERGGHVRPAGLRTVLLVSLTASIAMILANRLIATVGKTPDSFVQLDMMRLPLGVLTGVGFIGAGVIIHRPDMVLGVTTAATIWFATMIGFCFGAGQFVLGIGGTAIGMGVLSGLRYVEPYLSQPREAMFMLTVEAGSPVDEREIRRRMSAEGYRLGPTGVRHREGGKYCELSWEVRWQAKGGETQPPAVLKEFAGRSDVRELGWQPTYEPKA